MRVVARMSEERELRLLRAAGQTLNERKQELASGQRGARARLTHLRNRTQTMLDELDAAVRPHLRTGRLKKYEDAVEPVRRLLGR